MKIIDILNKKANGTLENGFKFCYENEVYTYNKKIDKIYRGNNILNSQIGDIYVLEKYLNNEVLLFQEEFEKREENKKIEELNYYTVISAVEGKFEENVDQELQKIIIKINELARIVNKLIKEREGK